MVALAAPFSHKLHMTMVKDCAACHTSAPKSTRAEDNNLPRADACQGCHDKVTIKEPRQTLVIKFDHQFHLKMAGKAGCAFCHKGLDQSEVVTKAAFPPMTDCLVCHNKIEPPWSCETCHSPKAELKPASHTNDWIDRHNRKSTVLDKPSCVPCHGQKFTCLGCH
jgi:Cytochrome c3